jgi:hypothetical protein
MHRITCKLSRTRLTKVEYSTSFVQGLALVHFSAQLERYKIGGARRGCVTRVNRV